MTTDIFPGNSTRDYFLLASFSFLQVKNNIFNFTSVQSLKEEQGGHLRMETTIITLPGHWGKREFSPKTSGAIWEEDEIKLYTQYRISHVKYSMYKFLALRYQVTRLSKAKLQQVNVQITSLITPLLIITLWFFPHLNLLKSQKLSLNSEFLSQRTNDRNVRSCVQ